MLGDAGRTGHVLVRAVGATTDETNFHLDRPSVLLCVLSNLRDGVSQIGGEGSIQETREHPYSINKYILIHKKPIILLTFRDIHLHL